MTTTSRKRLTTAAIALLGTAALLAAVTEPASPAAAADLSVSADFSTSAGTPTYVGAGFLYGLGSNGASPADSLLQPLKPTLFRGGGARMAGNGWIGDGYTDGSNYEARLTNALDEATRVTSAPYNAEYQVILTDLYGVDGTQPSGTIKPCANDDCTSWTQMVTNAATRFKNSGLSHIAFDIANEPVGTYGPANGTQYQEIWNSAYKAIRAVWSSATIVGPSSGQYDASVYGTFLDNTKAAGTVPNELTWHVFGAQEDPAADAASATALLAARSITGVKLSINEYLGGSQESPSYEAWFLARLAKSSVATASHAIWSSGPNDSLDNILYNTGSQLLTTGNWWVYQRYADETGSLVATTGSGAADLTASTDAAAGKASVLLGFNDTSTGNVTVNLNGLGSASYLNSGTGIVRATVYQLANYPTLAKPEILTDSNIAVTSGSAQITIPRTNGYNAYSVVLTPAMTASQTIDGNTTGTGVNKFQYSSGWGLSTGVADMYAGTANYSGTTNAKATFTFNAPQVALHAVKDTNVGKIGVSIDGAAETTVDNYSATRNASGIVYTSPTLAPGVHTVTVRITGTKNAASSGYADAIDSIDVIPAASQVAVDGNSTTAAANYWSYSSGWGVSTTVQDTFMASANYSSTTNATATLHFTGTRAILHLIQDNNLGICAVSVDGGSETLVDTYSATRIPRDPVFTSSNLAAGSHTLTVRVTGTKNSSSSGVNCVVDSADVIG